MESAMDHLMLALLSHLFVFQLCYRFSAFYMYFDQYGQTNFHKTFRLLYVSCLYLCYPSSQISCLSVCTLDQSSSPGIVQVATIMLLRLYPELLWDILSRLDAVDVVRLRMVRQQGSACHFITCAKYRHAKLYASKRTNVSSGSAY
jgi:hypothetical protein